jgi:hypothetical protein
MQGCQMVYFQTKNPILGEIMAVWYSLWSFGIFSPHFGMFAPKQIW